MKAKIKDNPNLEDCVFHIVVDGYNAPGFENDSESRQVFWLLKERELTPSNSNILDGRYDVFGGYVTHNEDFLADLKVDNVTE
uniref:peptidylprolyl isomerase n=1 Tax=Brassica oleracea var. oleracea TaxID=109376 RepID=A0A0D2ZXP1_BRAOL